MTRTTAWAQAAAFTMMLLPCLITGCSQLEPPDASPSGRMGAPGAAPVPPGLAGQTLSASAPAIPRTSDTLAYEHVVSIELSKVDIEKRVAEVQNACISSKQFECTLLDISTEGRLGVPRGTIRMRLAPAGVDAMIAVAAKGGEIVNRNTHAEDLAQPIADTERELTLMTTHRDRLVELQKRKDLGVDQLITVSKELATVQTRIDALSTQRANLRRRTETDVLTINLSLPREEFALEQHPVRDALRSFTGSLWEGVGMVISFLGYFLPWLVVIVPGLVLLRLFWRWMSRWIARREARLQP